MRQKPGFEVVALLAAGLGLAGAQVLTRAATSMAAGEPAAAASATATAAASSGSAQDALRGDAVHGKVLYQACAACHSIDENDIGPKHRGVVGRPAASLADYAYSAALKQSGITWDEATLDRWLINPSALVPGTKMYFKIDDAQSRADIIAFLREQK